MGVYEWNNYSKGTRAIAEKVSEDKFMSVIGGGSTVDAISKFGYESLMTHKIIFEWLEQSKVRSNVFQIT